MPNPRFPATATLLSAKQCPLDKFDALFAKITRERRIGDGYFLHAHPDETRLLFVVNGSPYAAGRVVGEACTSSEVHEFFAAYAEHPQSPLSFFVADKRLLLGLMVLFRHQPVSTFMTSLVDMSQILDTVGERQSDHVLAVRSSGEWAICLCSKGRLVANFLPPGFGDAGLSPAPTDQLAAYARSRTDGVAVDVYEETRVGPAGDVILVTQETQGRLVEVFLKVAERVKEEEAGTPHPLAVPPAESPAFDVISDTPEALEMVSEESPVLAGTPEEPVALEVVSEAPPAWERTPEASPAFAAAPEEPLVLEAESPPVTLSSGHEPVGMVEPPDMSAEPEMQPLTLEDPVEPVDVFVEAPADVPAAVSPPPESTPQTASVPKGPTPEVLLFLGDKQLGAFSLAAGELTIGRTPGNSIVIDNAGVSRRHAVIRVKGDKVVLEDLGSANGTFVRGQKIEEYTLRDGDEIAIVKHRLVYRIPKDADASPRVEPITDAGQKTMYIDSAAIAQAVGARQGGRSEAVAATLRPRLILPDLKKFALEDEEVGLGSGAGCQIQLSGMFVGKVHARIVRSKEGQFKIQHVSGLAGTRVNGEKISEHLLKHGDEIEIGKYRLLFRLER